MHAVKPLMVRLPAASSEMLSGSRSARVAGSRRLSEYAPYEASMYAIRSPAENPCTPAPTFSTTAAASKPGIPGSFSVS